MQWCCESAFLQWRNFRVEGKFSRKREVQTEEVRRRGNDAYFNNKKTQCSGHTISLCANHQSSHEAKHWPSSIGLTGWREVEVKCLCGGSEIEFLNQLLKWNMFISLMTEGCIFTPAVVKQESCFLFVRVVVEVIWLRGNVSRLKQTVSVCAQTSCGCVSFHCMFTLRHFILCKDVWTIQPNQQLKYRLSLSWKSHLSRPYTVWSWSRFRFGFRSWHFMW